MWFPLQNISLMNLHGKQKYPQINIFKTKGYLVTRLEVNKFLAPRVPSRPAVCEDYIGQ